MKHQSHPVLQAPIQMKFVRFFFISLFFFSIIQTGCKKIESDEISVKKADDRSVFSRNPDANCDLSTTICEDCTVQEQADEGEDDLKTILGDVYNNPYSIANMTAAYNYIYHSSISNIATTHYYVRFKAKSSYQLNTLDSLDLDLYDYPLDREIIQDGDYWPEAYTGLGVDEYPWLYTVVPKTFSFPTSILKEILAPLNIPDDNPTLEDEAYYITDNSVCDSAVYAIQREQIREFYRLAPINPCDLGGILDECTGGGGVGSGGSSPKPKGQINFKTYITNPGGKLGATAPLKYARVVGKRFLKIDKTYTDGNGNFVFKKRFPRKVTIVVKFKASVDHGQHSVRVNWVTSGVWRSMFPLKKNIGTYKGNNLQNLNYEFQKGSTSTKRKTKQWLAAVMMNTTEESRLFLSENNLVQLPDDLRLYLYAPEQQHVNNPQYDFLRRSNVPLLNQKRQLFADITDFFWFGLGLAGNALAVAEIYQAAATFLNGMVAATGVTLAASPFYLGIIPHKPDIIFYYKTSDINSITATKVSICAGQQLGIVYLSTLTNSYSPGTGMDTYQLAVNNVLIHHPYDTYAPFGNGPDYFFSNFEARSYCNMANFCSALGSYSGRQAVWN